MLPVQSAPVKPTPILFSTSTPTAVMTPVTPSISFPTAFAETPTMTSFEVEEKAFSLIAKYQPVASDLRIINSYMKVAYDFERFGRYAWDISFVATRFNAKISKCDKWIFDYIGKMAEKVLQMVQISINTLKRLDPELVKSMTEQENDVDKTYFDFLDKLVEQAGTTNECTVSIVLVVRYLERIADHAMHIMEAVVYVATGEKVTLR